MPNAAPDAVTRFREDIGRLTAGAGRFGIAVSGGPDSMALLLLATQAFPGRVEAATVDHGLRPEAAAEAELVGRWCAVRAIPHAILRRATPIAGSLQSAARVVRYALLEAWRAERGLDWLATAHHADDQLETLIMRLNRGSGVAGLAGVRARRGAVIRPLLGWRKAELLHVVEAEGVPYVQDPSNADPRFDRAALRASLADVDWLDPIAAARSAAALAEAEAGLQWQTRELAARHVVPEDGGWRLDRVDVPRELQRRLILHMLGEADPTVRPRGDTLDYIIVELIAGRKASIGDWLLEGGAAWTLRRAPSRRGPR